MFVFDHLVVSAETLATGAEAVQSLLGAPLTDVGAHDLMGTHNRLLSLGPGRYLEVISVDPAARRPHQARWFDLDRFSGPPRLTNWVLRSDDLEAAMSVAPEGMGVPIAMARADYLWQMAVPGDGRLPFDGAAPALIQWDGAAHPADRLPDHGCRLQRLTVEHPDARALVAAFPALVTLDGVDIVPGPEKRLTAGIDTPRGRVTLR